MPEPMQKFHYNIHLLTTEPLKTNFFSVEDILNIEDHREMVDLIYADIRQPKYTLDGPFNIDHSNHIDYVVYLKTFLGRVDIGFSMISNLNIDIDLLARLCVVNIIRQIDNINSNTQY